MEQMELSFYAEEHVTPHQEAYLWHLSNSMTGFVLEDCGRIVAFTDILPVNDDVFRRILSGTFNDKYLTADDLVNMDAMQEGDTVNLLLSCVVVREDYRKTDALKRLLNAHLDYYRGYMKKGIKIETVLTRNVTEDGERFSERMEFEYLGRTEHETALYRTSFQSLDEQVKKLRPRLETILLQKEKDLLNPEFCGNIQNLEDCIAEDFMEYGQSGNIYNRDDTIKLLQNKKDSHVTILDFKITCIGKQAAMAHYTAKDNKTTNASLRTSLWILEDKQWKISFHQGTAMQAKGKQNV
jgi:hypothetical protein